MRSRIIGIAAAAGIAVIAAATAQATDVNVYSYRQPFLVKPLFKAFMDRTGIKVNVVFAKKGLIERLRTEGMASPADLVFTVDIGRLQDAVDAGRRRALQDRYAVGQHPGLAARPGRQLVRAHDAHAPHLRLARPRAGGRHRDL